MNSDQFLATIAALQQSILMRRAKGEDTVILEIQVELYNGFFAQNKGLERFEMFAEERRDTYSAERAAAFFRAAADRMHEVGRMLERQSGDPHADVLKDAKIKDIS